MDKIKILALGGLDEDGKDLYVIEINDDIFVVGGGFKYPTKQTPGIDFIIADFTYLKENKHKIKGYIIPKSKENVFGAIPYIYKECPAPIYCTRLTKRFFLEFAERYNQSQDFDIREIVLPSKTEISGHTFWFFSTCSSVPYSFGFSIKTDLGNVVYSGDFVTEYNNAEYFNFDLNTVGKIAEYPTLILMCESVNAGNSGYCSPNNRITPHLKKVFKNAPGRIFVGLANDNFYHIEELFRMCYENNKKIVFYDEDSREIYKLKELRESDEKLANVKVINIEDILRQKDSDIVILMVGTKEKLYSKASMLANNEHENKLIKIQPNDTFLLACPPNENNEVIFTDTIDELYRSGCRVEYLTGKVLKTMHAFEEDIKMLISLLKPKYYFSIKGFYINLLANSRIAFSMRINLSHSNIFLLDNGQSINIDEHGAKVDFNMQNEVIVGDVMIDGIGVGDVVNEIIVDRTRLSEDGVIVLGCGVSFKERKIVYSPDVQMRGFLFLKDKDADLILKDVTEIFVSAINTWLEANDRSEVEVFEGKLNDAISRFLFKQNGRNPVIKSNIIVVD